MIARNKTRLRASTRVAQLRDQRHDRAAGGRRTFEAAGTTGYNAKHWLKADSRDVTSIVAEALPVLRNRCRYETRNNCWCKGIVTTMADALVGQGPRLQMLSASPDFNRSVEDRFTEWAGNKDLCDMRARLNFGQLVRLGGALQQCDSGESFVVLMSRNRDRYPVKLRLLMIEGDRVATPFEKMYDVQVRDGVEQDQYGRVIAYHVRRSHPGNYLKASIHKTDRILAAHIIHLFHSSRPGQTRGVPLLSPALMPLSQLRDFTHNVLVSADVAARITGVIQSGPDMDVTSDESYDAYDAVELETGTYMTLPTGMVMNQAKPNQPATTYDMFVAEKLKEVGRAINMPYNVIAGDSSKYNYASGRLDKQNWWKYITGRQMWLKVGMCNPIFRTWLREALLIPGYIDRGGLSPDQAMAALNDWFWPGIEHVDPQKEAKAQDLRIRNLTSTYATEYAKAGKDWETELRQAAREKELMTELNLTTADVAAAVEEPEPQEPEE